MRSWRLGRQALCVTGIASALTALVAACGPSNDDDPENAAAPSDTPSVAGSRSSRQPETAPTTAPHSEPTGRADARRSPRGPSATIAPSTDPVTISFAGDIHFEAQLRPLLDDPHDALAPAADQLSKADLTIVNLETSVGTSGDPEPKRYTFQAPPSAFEALAAAGVDVASMANNHAMDYGPEGFAETLEAARRAADADQPLSVVGIGADDEQALTPAVHDVRGTRVAVLGASLPDDPTADPTGHWAAEANQPGVAVALDPQPLLDAVQDARADGADVVVVYMHWGIQGESCPNDSQADLADALATAGADVVVGSHAHRLQGAGTLDDTYVAYGLGNFVWYTQSSGAASSTGVLTLTIDDGRVTQEAWVPARIEGDGLPRFTDDGERAQTMTEEFFDLRDCTDLRPLTRTRAPGEP